MIQKLMGRVYKVPTVPMFSVPPAGHAKVLHKFNLRI